MLAISGVRIYADNFSRRREPNNTQRFPPKPDTGDYKSKPFTRYMIFCGAYLPVASMAVYILLNKYWFLQIYWLIKNQGKSSVVTRKQATTFYKYQCIKLIPQSVKMMAFLRDPVAYFAVIFLMVPFIPFMVGTFLPDYDRSDIQLAESARSAAMGLGVTFLVLFLASNAQAAIIFIILVVILILVIIYLLCAFIHFKEMAKGSY